MALFVVQGVVGMVRPVFADEYLALSRYGIASGYIWQFVTYMFLHAGVIHLLANMLVIYFAGRHVEAIIGPKNLLLLYFAGGFLGGFAQLATTASPIVGASAAGFAVLIAFTTILPELTINVLLFFVVPIRLRAKYLGYGAVIVSVFFVVFPPADNIGHLAHLVGCIVGWGFVKLLGYGNRLPIENYFVAKQQHVRRERRMSPDEFISEEIDPILEKIAKEGMHSLTRHERRILERGREKIARKTSRH